MAFLTSHRAVEEVDTTILLEEDIIKPQEVVMAKPPIGELTTHGLTLVLIKTIKVKHKAH